MLVEFDPTALGDPNLPGKRAVEKFASKLWLPDKFQSAIYVPQLFVDPPRILVEIDDDCEELKLCVICVRDDIVPELLSDPAWQAVVIEIELGPALENPSEQFESSNSLPSDDSGGGAPSDGGATKSGLSFRGNKQRGALQVGGLAALLNWLGLPLRVTRAEVGATGAVSTPPTAVLTVVIDEGIAFAHERFRNGAGTRIAYFLNQDGPGLGVESSAAAIDAAVGAAKANGLGDGMAVYRAIGGLDFKKDGYKSIAHRRSHGTHVLDLAAGYSPTAAPANRPIIAVQLPDSAIEDTTGTALGPFKSMGLLYALLRSQTIAATFGGTVPVVVNLSYGGHAGPHDGRSLLEKLIDFLIQLTANSTTPFHIVLAAGNNRQGRGHAQFTVAPGATQTLGWRLQPDDRTPSRLQLWPRLAGANLRVQIQSPSGQTVTTTTGASAWFNGGAGVFLFGIYSASGPRFDVRVEPTAPLIALDPNQPTVPAGLWKVSVTNIGTALATVDGYIERDDTLRGHRSRGRQSFFEDDKYQRHVAGRPCEYDLAASIVTRHGTLSDTVTGRRSIVIGGYRASDNMPARYTSQGPVAAGALRVARSPNWLAPSDDSLACAGRLAAGTHNGTRVAMNGTSVAAPQAARWWADQLAVGNDPATQLPGLLVPPNGRVPPGDVQTVAGDGLMPAPPMPRTRGRP